MEIINISIDELTPYENNPRKNKEAVRYVKESIKEFGFKVPVVVDKNNVIVAGHTRVLAAKQLKYKEIPCIRADDLSDEQIQAFRLADNKTAEFAAWDESLLKSELDKLQMDMSVFGFEELSEDVDELVERKDVDVGEEKYQLAIDCENEEDMQEKYNLLMEMGIECRVLTL